MRTEKPIAIHATLMGTVRVMSRTGPRTLTSPTESASPNRPPIRLTASASIKNCIRMFPRAAPMALRMPISRVRSLTLTSMMFMMPMPPTSREMPAMPPSIRERVAVVSLRVESISVWLYTLYCVPKDLVL